MNTDSTTLYKLMILYMLSKVNFPLSNVQISTFMLDKEYTNYFTFQETINSLVEDSFIQQINYENNTQYKLTQEGEDTVAFFYTKISQTIQRNRQIFVETLKTTGKIQQKRSADRRFCALCPTLDPSCGKPLLQLLAAGPIACGVFRRNA